MAMADVEWVRGDHDQALATLRRGSRARVARSATRSSWRTRSTTSGMAAFQAGEPSRAQRCIRRSARHRATARRGAPHGGCAVHARPPRALSADGVTASTHGRQSLELYLELEDDRSSARCLVVLAGAAVAAGRHEDAARLLGAAASLRGDDAARRVRGRGARSLSTRARLGARHDPRHTRVRGSTSRGRAARRGCLRRAEE